MFCRRCRLCVWLTLASLLEVVQFTDSNRLAFDGYQVLSLQIDTEEDRDMFDQFVQSKINVDIWKWPDKLGDTYHVLLTPSDRWLWMDFCQRHQITCDVIIDDIQKMINEESASNVGASQVRSAGGLAGRSRRYTDDVLHRLSGRYPTYQQIVDWLIDLEAEEDLVEVISIGTTEEGRNLYVAKITASADPELAPAVWIDTGMHAREWVTVSSGVYIITQLVEGYYQNTTTRPLVEDLVWYIMPVVNPDGYAYSHETDRLWRKNRSVPPSSVRQEWNDTKCVGTDINRNWNITWGTASTGPSPCSQVYPGHEPMSELETQAIASFLQDPAHNINGYVNIHSYSQLFTTRYAYALRYPPDHTYLLKVAKDISQAITDTHGVPYYYGTAPSLIYAYSGGASDWAKLVAGIKFCYGVELRDKGQYGFLLPAAQIIPVGEEIFAGLRRLATEVDAYYGRNTNTTLTTAGVEVPTEDYVTTTEDGPVGAADRLDKGLLLRLAVWIVVICLW